MTNWEIITCTTIIMNVKVKLKQNAERFIFKSSDLNLKGYNFPDQAKKLKDIRNNICHWEEKNKKVFMKDFDKNIHLILKFLSDLKQWYKKNCTPHDLSPVSVTDNAIMQIKEKM